MISQWTESNKWDIQSQNQKTAVYPVTPEDFVELILEKDYTVHSKALEDVNILRKFWLENIIIILELLEKKFKVEEDLVNKRIYEKFILQAKWIILSYWCNGIADLLLESLGLEFLEVSYGFESGYLSGFDWEWNNKIIYFKDIDSSIINKIYEGINRWGTWIDWVQNKVKNAVEKI